MAYIPPHQIAFHAYKVGMHPDNLTTCVAIALGESDGDSRGYYYNARSGDASYGLWQVNMLGDLREERMRKYGLDSMQDLFDPAINARVMRDLYLESISWGYDGFRPWGAYTNGRYRTEGRWERATAGVALFKSRLADSGTRLHVGGEADCDSL